MHEYMTNSKFRQPHTQNCTMRTDTFTHTVTRSHAHTHTQSRTVTHTHTLTHTLTHTHTHTVTHSHAHTHSHTHTQSHSHTHTHLPYRLDSFQAIKTWRRCRAAPGFQQVRVIQQQQAQRRLSTALVLYSQNTHRATVLYMYSRTWPN